VLILTALIHLFRAEKILLWEGDIFIYSISIHLITSIVAAPLAASYAVMDKILDIVMATHDRNNKYIREGASPRAAQAIVKGAKARAFMEGRYNVSFDDVESVAYPVLRHRILLSFDAVSDNVTEDKIITGIIQKLGTQNG
jgi:MoxR-like ATPase